MTSRIPRLSRVSIGWSRGKKLLAQEKELTRQHDRVNAVRRRLPMVRIEKNYMFDGPGGEESLLDLFQGRRQLVVYHFMFDPSWEKGCPGCTAYANAIGDLSMLDKCDTTFVMVSRAPMSKLEAYKERQGWPVLGDLPRAEIRGVDVDPFADRARLRCQLPFQLL